MTNPPNIDAIIAELSEATPRPWRTTPAVTTANDLPCIIDGDDLIVAECLDDGHTVEECEANAELIVREVNERDALIAALTPFQDAYLAYVNVMQKFNCAGETSAERRFSEGEMRDEAIEAAYEALTNITFEQLSAVNAAIARAQGSVV